MELQRFNGTMLATKVVSNNIVQLARAEDGTWYALNYRSQSPLNLRNRACRSVWALAQGLRVKDVENWTRRERARLQRENAKYQLDEAKHLLEENGYTVVSP